MKKLTLPTILLFTLLTFSCSLILQEETTDVNFTISREAFARNGTDPNAKYKVDCFLTGGVNESQTLYLDESQKQGTFTFEKIPIGKNVNVKVRVYEYKEDLKDYWLVYGGLDSTKIQQKDNFLNVALNRAITITYVNSEDKNQKTTQRVISNEAINLDACPFTSETSGFTCIGWQSGDTKKVDYTDGQRVSFKEDTTLKTVFTNAQGYKFGNISIDGTEYSKTHDVVVIPKYTVANVHMKDDSAWNTYCTGSSSSGYDLKGVFIKDRNVTLSPFAIGAYEVTQELYEAVIGSNPSCYQGESLPPADGETQKYRPVEGVSWYDAVIFCNELTQKIMTENDCVYTIENKQYESFLDESGEYIADADVTIDLTKKGYRLPTEAEWEFAARGGDPTKSDWKYAYAGVQSKEDPTRFGTYDIGGDNILAPYAWYAENSNEITHQVGLKLPNRLGLYDMSGNVTEWCWELFEKTETTNNNDPYVYKQRIVRGGCVAVGVYNHAVSTRSYRTSSYRFATTGLRLVRSLVE